MKRIDGKRLATLRDNRGWTLEQAAKKTDVSRAQLQRLEKPGIKSIRPHTLKGICKGYGIDADALLPEQSVGPLDDRSITDEASWRVADIEKQMSARVSAQAKNAFALVAHHYGVTQKAIVEVAPLLFAIVAEQSFDERRSKLAEMRASMVQQANMSRAYFRHLSNDIYPRDMQEYAIDAEELSIDARDLLGRKIEEESAEEAMFDDDFNHAQDNPFAKFLQRLAANVARHVTFGDEGSEYYPMNMYREVFGGGRGGIAALGCAMGVLPFDAIPKDLLRPGKEDQRVEWLKVHADGAAGWFADEVQPKPVKPPGEGTNP